MQHKKISFIIIIVLLVIFGPLAIFSTTMRFANKEDIAIENATNNLQFKYGGKLYFYENETVLGTYTCEYFDDYCDYAMNSTNYVYNLNEIKLDVKEKLSLINNQYVFLIDSSIERLATTDIILYDIINNMEINRYAEIKKYDDNIYLAKDLNDLWGVLDFNNASDITAVPFMYNYIGFVNQDEFSNDLIATKTFAVLDQDNWSIIDINNNKLTNFPINNLFSFNKQYIISIENEHMNLLDYTGKNLLTGEYKYLNFYNKYLVVIESNDDFYLYDVLSNKPVTLRHLVTDQEELSFEIEDYNIKIYIGNDLSETIAIE